MQTHFCDITEHIRTKKVLAECSVGTRKRKKEVRAHLARGKDATLSPVEGPRSEILRTYHKYYCAEKSVFVKLTSQLGPNLVTRVRKQKPFIFGSHIRSMIVEDTSVASRYVVSSLAF